MRPSLTQSLSTEEIRRYLRLIACATIVVAPFPAVAQTAAPQASSEARAANPAFEASRQAFEALPEGDRKAIQDALVWVGAYSSTTGGVFGARTYEGIVAYQQRINETADGILTGKTLARLKAEGVKSRDAAGFDIVRDNRTGVDIGVPTRILPRQGVNPNGGSRWQSVDEKITLDTRRIATEESDLQSHYQRNIAIQTPGRKVTYKIIRPDFFVLTGETQTGKFYMRYASGPDGLRGFSLGYDKSTAASFDRVVIAIANSFTAFPEAAPSSLPAAARDVGAVRELADSSQTSSGFRVGPRQIVTLASCPDPVVNGVKARLVKQEGSLALVETGDTTVLNPLSLRAGPLPAGANVVIIAQNAAMGGSVVSTGIADGEGHFTAPLQTGAGGGLIFDRGGALVGIVATPSSVPRSISGVLVPSRYMITAVNDVQRFTGGDALLLTESSANDAVRSTGEIAATASRRVVGVSCNQAR